MSSDLLQSGLTWLHGQRLAHMTSAAVYYPAGSSLGTPLQVTATQVRETRFDANGLPVEAILTDFLVTAADMVADPEPGAIIEYGGTRFEVQCLDGEKCWRWTDQSRLSRRIHTQDIGPEGS